MAFWKNLFDPIPEDGATNDSNNGFVGTKESADKSAKKGIVGDLKCLRRTIDPDGQPKDTSPAEFKDLAAKAGFTAPAGMKFKEQVTALWEYVYGKKEKPSSKSGRSIPDFVDEMVSELGLHPDPADDTGKKLELVEAELGRDSAEQAEKPLKTRIVECWRDIFGA